jgi:hypothetical protein
MPLKTVTDGPLFGRPEGTLSQLTNMTLRDGYAEARGGFSELMPSGGTKADAISAGCFSSIIQNASSLCWVRSFDSGAGAGSQYSRNLILDAGGWEPFPGSPTVTDALYVGSDSPFSRISASLCRAGAWVSATFVYEYWNGAWTALTTAETISWTTSPTLQFASWTLPSDWTTTTVGDAGTGNVLKYWMRIRLSAINTPTVIPLVQVFYSYGSGMREVFVATQSPRTSATAGTLKRHGQSSTTEEWFAVNSALFSASASPSRMVSYRGRVILVNGKETKRYDGSNFVDLGIPVGSLASAFTVALGGVTSGGLGNGVWRYYAAYGCGPCQNYAAYADRQDAQALYGVGQAVYIGEVTTVAGANENVTFTYVATTQADVGAVYLYRTQDLTNVPSNQRAAFPAFLVQSFRRKNDSGTTPFEVVDVSYSDQVLAPAFPPQEAKAYDVSPPTRCRFVGVHQNRLLLGDAETWYISDPFTPDVWSAKSTTAYIRLAKATGGRHMGGVEFGDQFVMFTEDQTWGLTNIDLDVTQLYPIAEGVGCIAPDSIAIGDGWLVWLAKDGFYAWDGGRSGPKKVSQDFDLAFLKMSYENHGGTRGTIHNRMYDVRLATPNYSSLGTAYRLNLENMKWSILDLPSFDSTLFPFATIHAPLGNADEGVLHPVWAKADYGASSGEYGLMLGELTTRDNGTSYDCSATMYFPLPPNAMLRPNRVLAYYSAPNGWGTPVFDISAFTGIGGVQSNLISDTPATGDDYSILGGKFDEFGAGTSDLKVKFTATSAAGGTVNGQRFYGAVLEGAWASIGRYAV